MQASGVFSGDDDPDDGCDGSRNARSCPAGDPGDTDVRLRRWPGRHRPGAAGGARRATPDEEPARRQRAGHQQRRRHVPQPLRRLSRTRRARLPRSGPHGILGVGWHRRSHVRHRPPRRAWHGDDRRRSAARARQRHLADARVRAHARCRSTGGADGGRRQRRADFSSQLQQLSQGRWARWSTRSGSLTNRIGEAARGTSGQASRFERVHQTRVRAGDARDARRRSHSRRQEERRRVLHSDHGRARAAAGISQGKPD